MDNIEDYRNKIIQGDALEVLQGMPSNSVNMILTSPPYWSQRDYQESEQMGLESTYAEYIDSLCNLFDEAHRVLRDDGTCWVVIGDTYSSGNRAVGGGDIGNVDPKYANKTTADYAPNRMGTGLPDKCLIGIPERFVLEMIARGWIRRNTIVWQKPNAVPHPAKDRFTVDFEYIYFFVKKKKYAFTQQITPYTKPMNRWGGDKLKANGKSMWDDGTGQSTYRDRDMRPNPDGRNKRTVWTINTKGNKIKHYASYPEELCVTPIKAGCPKEICQKCGKARERLLESKVKGKFKARENEKYSGGSEFMSEKTRLRSKIERIDKGYTDCGCGAGWQKGVVLDPFVGSGTTAAVARNLGRDYVGIELNAEYVKIAKNRLAQQHFGI